MIRRIFTCLVALLVAMIPLAGWAQSAYLVENDHLRGSFTTAMDTQLAEYTANVPQISGMEDQDIMSQVNTLLLSAVQDQLRAFDSVAQYAKIDYMEAQQEGIPWELGYGLGITNEVTLLTDRVLSILFLVSSNTGGAHPNNMLVPLIVDLGNADLMTMDMLVSDEAAFQKRVVEHILAEIAQSGNDQGYYEDYADVVRQWNLCSAYLTPQGVVAYFDYYEIAPYAAGTPSFTIPYDEIRDLLNERGALLIS